MFKKINKLGFTFAELIVVVTILAILGSIGFSSYIGSIADSRDSQRKADLSQVASALKIYKQKRGYYALPGDNFNIVFSGTIIAKQGKLNTNTRINSLEKLPRDPENKVYYSYSITDNKQEFELAASLENSDNTISLVTGNYKSVSVNNVPTILLAADAVAGDNLETQSGTVDGDINKKLFIYDNQSHNLTYTFDDYYKPYSDGTEFNTLLDEMKTNGTYWQNTDFRNCVEIKEAGKMFPVDGEVTYQIIDSNGDLTNTGCTYTP